MQYLDRTSSSDPAFQQLVAQLDKYLQIVDGDDHGFYDQFNKIDTLKNAVVYYIDGQPAACGAFKPYNEKTVEIKRMFVMPANRGKGIAMQILQELEAWAAELNYTAAILETGKKQFEAVALYQKAGYSVMPNYGQYQNVENSVCMKKGI